MTIFEKLTELKSKISKIYSSSLPVSDKFLFEDNGRTYILAIDQARPIEDESGNTHIIVTLKAEQVTRPTRARVANEAVEVADAAAIKPAKTRK